MDEFKKELQKLSVDEFIQGEVTPLENQGQDDPAPVQQCGRCYQRCFGCGGCFGCYGCVGCFIGF
jgi:heterocycloanthracin/sonorensin family bacteriocin